MVLDHQYFNSLVSSHTVHLATVEHFWVDTALLHGQHITDVRQHVTHALPVTLILLANHEVILTRQLCPDTFVQVQTIGDDACNDTEVIPVHVAAWVQTIGWLTYWVARWFELFE